MHCYVEQLPFASKLDGYYIPVDLIAGRCHARYVSMPAYRVNNRAG
jgi:hypothetical protein